jgi:hypothetical protein
MPLVNSGYRLGQGGYYKDSDGSGPYAIDSAGVATLIGSGGGAGGSVTVTNFPATQPVSAAALPLPTGAATSAAQTTGNNSLSSIDGKLPAQSTGAVPVETIKQVLVARQLAVAASSGASANTALTTTCRRISIYARGADVRYAIGSSGQTASATSHFIAAGERLDLAVPATPNIAVLGATPTTGTLEVSELS